MIKVLVCIAQKYTTIPIAFCELKFKSRNYHFDTLLERTEIKTGIKIDGIKNYIEWVEI